MIFSFSSISSGLEFWSVYHGSICENSESNVFKDIKFLGEMFNNWPNDLLGTNVYKTLEFCWQLLLRTLKCIYTASEIPKRGTFSPFLSSVILLLVLPSNFIVSGVKSWR